MIFLLKFSNFDNNRNIIKQKRKTHFRKHVIKSIKKYIVEIINIFQFT